MIWQDIFRQHRRVWVKHGATWIGGSITRVDWRDGIDVVLDTGRAVYVHPSVLSRDVRVTKPTGLE